MEHRRELVGSVQKLDGGQKHRYGVSWLVLYLVSERRSKWTVLAWLLLAVRHARGTSVLVPFTWKVKMLGGLRKGAGEEKAPYDGLDQSVVSILTFRVRVLTQIQSSEFPVTGFI